MNRIGFLPSAAPVPFGGWVLGFDGRLGLHGWQWLFLIEGLPSIVLGATALLVLSDGPETAPWLPEAERNWLIARLRHDGAGA